MNIERWIKARNSSWLRLEDLLKRIEKRGLPSLSGEELQELGRLYKAISSDLSRARAMKVGSETEAYLNNLLIKAHNQVYQGKGTAARLVLDYFLYTFPNLVRTHIVYVAVAFAIFAASFAVSFSYAVQDNQFGQLELLPGHQLVPEDVWACIDKGELWTDPTQHFSPGMAATLYTNNIRVSILAFVLGIVFGIGTFYVLLQNGLMNGAIIGVCQSHGMAVRLLSFVASHGVLELTAIFISGGAGFMLAKALLFPGRVRRLDALRLISKPAFGLFGGCIPLLLLAGMIEGFLSPRTDLSATTKAWVGAATACFLLLYLFVPLRSGSKQ
jgi:uncharacterized membrane protein SpoIIM required for sporulation